MKLRDGRPDCLGTQGQSLPDGGSLDACLACDWFDKCHKLTVAGSLQVISDAMDLIIENGLADGRLKGFEELEKLSAMGPGRK